MKFRFTLTGRFTMTRAPIESEPTAESFRTFEPGRRITLRIEATFDAPAELPQEKAP